MEHNNKNLALSEILDNITLNLATIDFATTEETLQATRKVLKIIDQIAQKMNIPSLRALSHWMLLSTEQNDSNAEQIKELCFSGSYFNWIEILSSLLQTEDRSLLEKLQSNLDNPNWFIKPSSILLKDLFEWLDTATDIQSEPELEKPELLVLTAKENSLANYDDKPHPHIYKEVELDIVDKNYCNTPNTEILKQLEYKPASGSIEAEKKVATTKKL